MIILSDGKQTIGDTEKMYYKDLWREKKKLGHVAFYMPQR
jgi:hypothetical protein